VRQPVGIIVAGGLATRMGGGDKCLLPLKGQTVIDHVIERIEPQVSKLALNANGDADRFAHLGMPVCPDSISGYAGPLCGVLAGLDWAATIGETHVVSVAADTPFLPCDLVPNLMLRATGDGLALAASPGGRQPTFGLWPVSLRDDLRHAIEDGVRKVVQWTARHDAGTAEFPDDRAFFNVNTPQDLRTAETM